MNINMILVLVLKIDKLINFYRKNIEKRRRDQGNQEIRLDWETSNQLHIALLYYQNVPYVLTSFIIYSSLDLMNFRLYFLIFLIYELLY
jgi:uncharacterized membrane protein